MKIRCPNCKQALESEDDVSGQTVQCPGCGKNFTAQQDQSPYNVRVIAQVGQKYSTSLLSGAGFSKTSLILTNKTLSGVGKTYTAKSKGIVSFEANLRDVSSLGIEYTSHWILILIGIMTLWLFGLGLLFIALYFVSKERYIVVNVQGALYALSLRGISNQDIQSFIEIALAEARA